MKAIVTEKKGEVFLKDIVVPKVSAGALLIETKCSLISPGTELHYIHNSEDETLLGYCASGAVLEIGEGVNGFSAGDRVIAMGWSYAIHAERIVVPYKLCVRIPDDVPFEEAVFANLAATSLHAIHRALIKKEDKVLIIGGGLVGQLLAQLVKKMASSVFLHDDDRDRIAISKQCGIDVIEANPDFATCFKNYFTKIFLCLSGDATNTFSLCQQLLSKSEDGHLRGRIVCVGRFKASINFDVSLGNIDLVIASRCGAGYKDKNFELGKTDYAAPEGEGTVSTNLKECLSRIRKKELNVGRLITDTISFDQGPSAYTLFQKHPRSLGVVLKY
jgi:2-desacetyl-2-hydroxyethyl bacteriochlorophyllide A dehydrogenase